MFRNPGSYLNGFSQKSCHLQCHVKGQKKIESNTNDRVFVKPMLKYSKREHFVQKLNYVKILLNNLRFSFISIKNQLETIFCFVKLMQNTLLHFEIIWELALKYLQKSSLKNIK